jgi:hypothetical protein
MVGQAVGGPEQKKFMYQALLENDLLEHLESIIGVCW